MRNNVKEVPILSFDSHYVRGICLKYDPEPQLNDVRFHTIVLYLTQVVRVKDSRILYSR